MTKTLSAFALLLCLNATAQESITNQGTLQIHTGASVAAFGNFTNTTTAALVNNGTLYVKANIANDQASMTAGTGTLHLNGTSAQTLSGSAAFKTYNLTTNNASGIALSANLSVSGAHTFSSGMITPAVSNFLVYEAGASYTGSGDSRHVNGWVKKFGSTDFIFPVGSATLERSISLVSLTASSEFNARYRAPTPNTAQLQGPIVSLDEAEYWGVTKVSGGSASVTMNWNNSKVAFPNWQVSMIKVAQYNGSQWIDQGGTASGTTTATGTITSSSVSSFNLFTFGSRDFVLPLSLLSFEGRRMAGYTQFRWKTTNEKDVRYFRVERSDNSTQFYNIYKTAARNTGNDEVYVSEDRAPINGKAWYRLRSVDNNGVEKLSPVISVSEGARNTIILVTNPVHDHLTLQSFLPMAGTYRYQIRALDGKTIQEGALPLPRTGLVVLPFSQSVVPGIYTISIYNAGQQFNLKFQVQ